MFFNTGSNLMGEFETRRDVPIKLRIFASYLLIKSLHFGEHPETAPYNEAV